MGRVSYPTQLKKNMTLRSCTASNHGGKVDGPAAMGGRGAVGAVGSDGRGANELQADIGGERRAATTEVGRGRAPWVARGRRSYGQRPEGDKRRTASNGGVWRSCMQRRGGCHGQ